MKSFCLYKTKASNTTEVKINRFKLINNDHRLLTILNQRMDLQKINGKTFSNR